MLSHAKNECGWLTGKFFRRGPHPAVFETLHQQQQQQQQQQY